MLRRSFIASSIAAAVAPLNSLLSEESGTTELKIVFDSTAFITAIDHIRRLLDIGALSDADQRQLAHMHETNTLCVFREGVKDYAPIWYMLPSQSLQRLIERAQTKAPASPTSAAWLSLVSAMG